MIPEIATYGWEVRLMLMAEEVKAEIMKMAEHERRAIGQRFRWHLYRLSVRKLDVDNDGRTT